MVGYLQGTGRMVYNYQRRALGISGSSLFVFCALFSFGTHVFFFFGLSNSLLSVIFAFLFGFGLYTHNTFLYLN